MPCRLSVSLPEQNLFFSHLESTLNFFWLSQELRGYLTHEISWTIMGQGQPPTGQPPSGSGPVTTGFQYLFTLFNKIYLILSLYNSILIMAIFNIQLKSMLKLKTNSF